MGIQPSSGVNSNFKSMLYKKYQAAVAETSIRKETARNSEKAPSQAFSAQASKEVALDTRQTAEIESLESSKSVHPNYDRLELSQECLRYLQLREK
jgi:hypothetical protein